MLHNAPPGTKFIIIIGGSVITLLLVLIMIYTQFVMNASSISFAIGSFMLSYILGGFYYIYKKRSDEDEDSPE